MEKNSLWTIWILYLEWYISFKKVKLIHTFLFTTSLTSHSTVFEVHVLSASQDIEFLISLTKILIVSCSIENK